ncbi:hypothetical protein K488DRAFT_89494 [Vararia minispora EC-137]|uniref:Uncharacterized protein n=1 Tax=Vararia minispora EC-137 TaxID=1314806 RepID=A0ACB8QAS0_9AGAM|nr:hypothetical protein K488DRAFT_89494 [Vararia minispora EC-137]
MAEIKVRKLVNPTEEELDKCAECLAAAFANDAFTNAVIGGDKALILPFERATVACNALAGEIWVASCGDEQYASVATWFAPGRDLMDSPDQGEAGFNALFGQFRPELATWWMEYFLPKYNTDLVAALGDGGKLGAWHLQLLGTRPTLQRKGLARAVLAPIMQRAKEDGKLLSLEAEEEYNIEIYKRIGWKVKWGPEKYDCITPVGFQMWVLIANEEGAAKS